MNVSECVGDSGCDMGGSCTQHSFCTEETHCGQTTKAMLPVQEPAFDLAELKASLRRQLAASAAVGR
jgi:hypothetical protein